MVREISVFVSMFLHDVQGVWLASTVIGDGILTVEIICRRREGSVRPNFLSHSCMYHMYHGHGALHLAAPVILILSTTCPRSGRAMAAGCPDGDACVLALIKPSSFFLSSFLLLFHQSTSKRQPGLTTRASLLRPTYSSAAEGPSLHARMLQGALWHSGRWGTCRGLLAGHASHVWLCSALRELGFGICGLRVCMYGRLGSCTEGFMFGYCSA